MAQPGQADYVDGMKMPLLRSLAIAVAATLAFGTLDAVAAPRKKHRAKRAPIAAPTVVRDYDGTPIIMKGYPTYGIPDIMREEKGTPPRVEHRRIAVPRGSSTYIPPPVPSPNAANSPPPPQLLQPTPPPYQPPPIKSFSDRVRNCIHSAPLNTGVGNNPANSQAYIGQCAN